MQIERYVELNEPLTLFHLLLRVHECMCLCAFKYVRARECIDVGGGQRTILQSWFSPCTVLKCLLLFLQCCTLQPSRLTNLPAFLHLPPRQWSTGLPEALYSIKLFYMSSGHQTQILQACVVSTSTH